jgi:hypothetical protein
MFSSYAKYSDGELLYVGRYPTPEERDRQTQDRLDYYRNDPDFVAFVAGESLD